MTSMAKRGIMAEVLAIWGVSTGILASIIACDTLTDWCAAFAAGFAIAFAVFYFFYEGRAKDDVDLVE